MTVNDGSVRVTRSARRFAIFLLFLVLVMGSANLVSGYLQNRRFESELLQQYNKTQQQQQAQGRAIDERLCNTLDRLAALKAPAGSADDNPSRAYEQELAMTLAELKPDIGCDP
jgi:type VI protein secretion system component VasK